jgi:hypothetical protein
MVTVSSNSSVGTHEIHVLTPDGDRWVLDFPAVKSLRFALRLHAETVACLRSGAAPDPLAAEAIAMRRDLLLAGIDPLDCKVQLVCRDAAAGAHAPNGWRTVLTTGAVASEVERGAVITDPDDDDDADGDDDGTDLERVEVLWSNPDNEEE